MSHNYSDNQRQNSILLSSYCGKGKIRMIQLTENNSSKYISIPLKDLIMFIEDLVFIGLEETK